MKDYCVIFDTNTLTGNKNKLNDIKSKIDLVADIFIPRIVIEEIEGQKSRIVNDDYLKIKYLINKNSDMFVYDEKFDLSEVLKTSEINIKKWLEKYCDNNVIEYGSVSLDDIITKVKYKMPPFINEAGSSDKGFKDSIIWISILKDKRLNNYKKVLFVTKDKTGFMKRKEELYNEFGQKHTIPIVFCYNIDDLYHELNIINLDVANTENEKFEFNNKKIDNIQDIKEELNACVNNIFYNIYEDSWGYEHCENKFEIYTKMDNDDVECFLLLLDDFLKENIFFNEINISDLLIGCGIESTDSNVSVTFINELNNIYKNLKDNKDLYKPFINFLKVEFNKLYKDNSSVDTKRKGFGSFDDSELPF